MEAEVVSVQKGSWSTSRTFNTVNGSDVDFHVALIAEGIEIRLLNVEAVHVPRVHYVALNISFEVEKEHATDGKTYDLSKLSCFTW